MGGKREALTQRLVFQGCQQPGLGQGLGGRGGISGFRFTNLPGSLWGKQRGREK